MHSDHCVARNDSLTFLAMKQGVCLFDMELNSADKRKYHVKQSGYEKSDNTDCDKSENASEQTVK